MTTILTREDGKFVHYELLRDWIENPKKRVQYQLGRGGWMDCKGQPKWNPCVKYRFAPIELKYRNYIAKVESAFVVRSVNTSLAAKNVVTSPDFIEWVGDWQVKELPQ